MMTTLLSSIWLAAMVFVVCTDCAVTLRLTGVGISPLADTRGDDATTKRLLRDANKTVNKDDEERGVVFSPEDVTHLVEEASVRDAEVVQKWKSEGKTGLGLFQESQVDDNALNTLNSPFMNALVLFFDRSGEKTPLIEHFSNKYGEDGIAKALYIAHQSSDPVTSGNAKKLLNQLLNWHVTQETSARRFFSLMNLPHDETSFGRVEFIVWTWYVDALRKAGLSQETEIEALASVFGGEKKLAAIVSLGVKDPDPYTRKMAAVSETSLLKKWEREDLDPVHLLKRLEMDERPLADLSSLGVVIKYIDQYAVKNPTTTFSLSEWLSKRYSSIVVTNVLAAVGADDPKIEKALHNDWLRYWHSKKEAGDAAFFTVNIEANEYEVLTSPTLTTLKRYIALRKADGREPNVVLLCDGFCDRDLAMLLSKAIMARSDTTYQEKTVCGKYLEQLYQKWYDNGVKPSELGAKYFNDDQRAEVEVIIVWYEIFSSRQKGPNRMRSMWSMGF